MQSDHRTIELDLLSRLIRRGGYLDVSSSAHLELGISPVLLKDMLLDLLCDSCITGAEPDVPVMYTPGQELADPRMHLWRANHPTLRQVLGGKYPCTVRITHLGLVRAARLQEELDRGRALDPLGVLIDGRYIERDLRLRLAGVADGSCVSLLMADMDNFKMLNDTLGHGCGDDALRRYFSLLRDLAATTGGDAYRKGGDETIAILPNVAASTAESLANTLREGVKAECTSFSDKLQRPLAVSVGVITLAKPTEAKAALTRLDELLYRAKRGGGDQVATGAGA
jgi:diguanylate cyclase (GGDEF)-like protein